MPFSMVLKKGLYCGRFWAVGWVHFEAPGMYFSELTPILGMVSALKSALGKSRPFACGPRSQKMDYFWPQMTAARPFFKNSR